MRISTLPGDPGFLTREERKRIVSVEVNGVSIPLHSIIWADEEVGNVMTVIRNSDGKPVEHHERSGHYLTEVRSGKVRITKMVAPHIM